MTRGINKKICLTAFQFHQRQEDKLAKYGKQRFMHKNKNEIKWEALGGALQPRGALTSNQLLRGRRS